MIHYICQYGETGDRNKRKYSPAGQTKMEYIILCLKELGCEYTVYSTCQAENPKYQKKKRSGNTVFRSSFATKNKYTFRFERIWAIFQLFFYLLCIPKTDTVIVYHERFYMRWVNAVQRIKKWKLIIEVEEIYTLARNMGKKANDKEINSLKSIKNAGHIISTDLLKKYFPEKSVVCNGAYNPVLFDNDESNETYERINIVYAGTLDRIKGGAFAAVSAAEYLDSNYHIHILGFGSDSQIEEIKKLTEDMNKKGGAKVTYDGVLRGKDYISFLKKCDIGLATQNPDGKYNDTSFPSKIFEYLKNGLKVVSIDIPAVRVSGVSDVITFYDKQEPQLLAGAIESAKEIGQNRIKATLDNLHEDFKKQLLSII